MAFKPFDDLSCAALHAAFPAALLCLTLSGWSAPAVSQVLPPWRVDTMASRDVNDWLEFAQPALPSSSDRPVDDADADPAAAAPAGEEGMDAPAKKRRRRRRKPNGAGGDVANDGPALD